MLHRTTKALLALAWLILALTQVAHSMPDVAQPHGHFLKWAADTYGPPLSPTNLAGNILFDFGQGLTFQSEGWVDYWKARKHMANLDRLGGVWKDKGKDDLDNPELLAAMVKAVLVMLAHLLQPKLTEIAQSGQEGEGFRGNDAWKIFAGTYSWVRSDNRQVHHMCMPYERKKLKKGKKSAAIDQAKHFKLEHRGKNNKYLRVEIGRTVPTNKHRHGQPVLEYAHRLVCYAFHGKPPGVADGDNQQWHVAHLCNNPACLNPRHLRWSTLAWNKSFSDFWDKAGVMPPQDVLDQLDQHLQQQE